MVISIDFPNNVNELLFIRKAWGLSPDVDIPPLAPEPNPGKSSLPSTGSIELWSARWEAQWSRAMEWYSISDSTQHADSAILREQSRPGQPLHPAVPPFWGTEFGDDGIDGDAFWSWQREIIPRMDIPFEEHPERVSLPALINAWNSGLTSIVAIPYAGYFALRISPTHLVVSIETRAHAATYSQALEAFATLL